MSVHATLTPGTGVLPTVGHAHGTFAVEKIVLPLTFVDVAIGHFVNASTVFETLEVVALERTTVVPVLATFTVRDVSSPLAFVAVAVLAGVDAVAVSVVVHPATLVATAVRMCQGALAPYCVLLPLTAVDRSVGPTLSARSLFHSIQDVTLVYSSVLVLYDFQGGTV